MPPHAVPAVGGPRRRGRAAPDRAAAGAARTGERGGDARRAPRSPARADDLAGGRRPVHHPAGCVHRASRPPRPQPRDVPPADPRCAHHRHALADRQGRRLPLRGGGGPGRRPARHRLPRRSAGPDPGRGGAAAGERARADARVADRGRAPAARRGPGAPPGAGRRRVRPHRVGSPGDPPARGGPSATTTGTTRSATTTRSSRSTGSRTAGTPSSPPPWWASPARRTSSSATSCRTCCRRCSPSSCPPSSSSGRTARPATTRCRRPSSGSAMPARRWPARSGFSARGSSRSRSSCW